MSHHTTQGDRTAELRKRATLREYVFTSDTPVIGGLVARLREAWNSVATRPQVRPLMEQQSAFNRALADWLERPPGLPELDTRLAEQDRHVTRLFNAVGTVEAQAAFRQKTPAAGRHRLRLAYFSPMPPDRSGIADYSAELLPHLAKLADVTIFTDDPGTAQSSGLTVRPTSDYPHRRREFDLPLYQMGNSAFHESMYDLLVRYPGVVMLHDYFLHHFIRHHTAGHDDWTAYGREMAYSLGSDGRDLAQAIHAGRAEAPLYEEPLNRRLLDASLGLIVHSRYAAERVSQQQPDVPLAVIAHLALPDARLDGDLRARLELPAGTVLFGSFGQITPGKRIDLALQAFQRMHRSNPSTHYLLVGEVQPDVDLPALIAACGLENAVHSVGFIADPDEFVSWIHAADVVVNLRQPTVGETSGVAIRAMTAALPLIVFDHGWYSELPDEAAVKTAPGDIDALQAAMERLTASAETRRSMGAAGLAYIHRHCLPQHVARTYIDFLYHVLETVGHG